MSFLLDKWLMCHGTSGIAKRAMVLAQYKAKWNLRTAMNQPDELMQERFWTFATTITVKRRYGTVYSSAQWTSQAVNSQWYNASTTSWP